MRRSEIGTTRQPTMQIDGAQGICCNRRLLSWSGLSGLAEPQPMTQIELRRAFRLASRILAPGLSALDPYLPEEVAAGNHLSTAWRCFEKALDDFMQEKLVAA
jgi:hypothetical protein